MTDNEIVKALECYRGHKLFTFNGKKPEIYIHDIIDLINHLKAEIEQLKEIKSPIVAKQLNTENNINIAQIKSEAYREFADKVKMEAENATCVYEPDRPQADNMVYHISNIRLNKILKELVGEDDG